MFKKGGKHKGQRGFVYEVKATVKAMVVADRDLGPLTVFFCRGRQKTESVEVDENGMLDLTRRA